MNYLSKISEEQTLVLLNVEKVYDKNDIRGIVTKFCFQKIIYIVKLNKYYLLYF